MKNSIKDLEQIIEKIRSKDYPSIPPELIKEIIEIQCAWQDNADKRLAETQNSIMQYVKKLAIEPKKE